MTTGQPESEDVDRYCESENANTQERALRYLERKRLRYECLSDQGDDPTDPKATKPRLAVPDLPLKTQPPLVSQPSPTTVVVRRAAEQHSSSSQAVVPIVHADLPAASSLNTYRALNNAPTAQRWGHRQKLLVRHLARKHMRQDRLRVRRNASRFWLTIGSSILSLFLLFFSITGTGAYVTYRVYRDTQDRYGAQVGGLRALLPRDNLKMYDSKGVPIGQLTDQGLHTSVKLSDVSQAMIDATVSTEDKNFWTNPGVDLLRTVQAALDDVRSGHVVEGGSTITQQLIKKLVVGDQVSVERKLQEIMLTPMLNSQYTKSDILEMYLNTVYYGEQAYGVDAAANVYFGIQDKPGQPASKQLDLAQAAMLAGIINSPDGNDPFQHPQAAFQRLNFVLDRMVEDGRIQRVDALDALKEAQGQGFFKTPALPVNLAPHFFNFVLLQLQHSFHLTRQQLSRSDMSVYTTLDLGLQDKIQQIAQDHIAQLRDINHATNAAEVLIDYHTGAVRSLLGSIDYNNKSIDGEFDVATQGYRQPGSSFKPYVYVAAFEQGISPAQAIDDQPLTIDLPGENPPTFSPKNYDLKYHGHMTLRCALQNSLNIPAVKVLQHVGIDNAVNMAHSMGITDTKGFAGYSLVLGGLSIHLIDHTSAYGTFANGGVHVPYYSIDKVVFASTGQTYGHPFTPGTQVISPQLAYMMTNVLSDNASRIPEFYDCNPLQLYSNSQYDCYAGNRGVVRPAAAKTGTTTDFRDNWTVGYTTDYVMGVWAGNNDNSPMINVTGVQGAAPIWHDAMLAAEEDHPIHDFTNPGDLERATVTFPDGVQTTDWFLPGTEPSYSLTTTPFPGMPSDNQGDNGDQPGSQNQHPYCPGSYTFATPPPSDTTSGGNNGATGNNGWW